MPREVDFRRIASELTQEAGTTEDEDRRDRLMQRASHYVKMAKNEGWLHSQSMMSNAGSSEDE